jgi:hypothetical protein
MEEINAIAFLKASNDFGLSKDRFLSYLQQEYQLDEVQSLILAAEILHVFPRNVEGNSKVKAAIKAASIRVKLSRNNGINN